MIQRKPLTAAPPRLQRMLLRLEPYDVTIRYCPGKDVPVADCLSRRPLDNAEHIHLDLQINFVQVAPDRLSELKRETANDAELTTLCNMIMRGWPEQGGVSTSLARATPRCAETATSLLGLSR